MIKIIDLSYTEDYFSEEKKVELQYHANKIAKKYLDYSFFSNLEYCEKHGYFNLEICYHGMVLKFQLLLKEKEIYYQYDSNNSNAWKEINRYTRSLIEFLSNQNDHNNRFSSLKSASDYLYMIHDSMVN